MSRTRTPKSRRSPRIAKPNKGWATLVPGNPGNSGGKKGRSGRPTKAFLEFCTALAKDPTYQRNLATTAKNPKHKDYMRAAQMIAAYAEGLPTQKVVHAGEITVDVTAVRDKLAARLAGRAAALRTG